MGKAEKQRKLSDAVSKIKERKKPQKGLVATMKRLINTPQAAFAAGLGAMYWGWVLSSPLQYLDTTSEKLKEVFYGRQPWLVICSNGSSVDSVFEATSRKKKDVSFGVLDCAKQLPSKKTTIQRLKLNQYVNGPLMFFSGYGRDIKQLPEKLLRNEYSLQKQLTAETAIHAAKVRDTEGLIKKCRKKTPCALLLAGGDLDPGAVKTLNAASDATKTISWVYLDASKVKFSGSGDRYSEKDLNLRKFMPGEHRLLMLGTYTGPMEADDEEEPGPMLFAKPYYGSFLEEPVTEFAVSYSQDSQEDESEPFSIRLLDLAKRRPPQVPRQSAPSSGPTAPPSPDTEATVLPTAQVEENKKAAEARRVEREAARRAQMDAEAEDFIEADDDDDDEDEGEDGGDDDEDDEDEDEVDLD